MPDSLLDFGNIAALAQGQLRNTMSMAHLVQQEEQQEISKRNAAVQEQNLFQTELKNTYELSKDERLQFMPEVRDQLLRKVAVMAGSPDIGIEHVTHSMATRDQYLRGLVSGDRDEAMKGLQGLATSMPIDKLDNLMKATVGMEETQEKILKIRQWREMNQGKVESLQNDNARVAISKPLYTAVSATFRDDLRGTDSPQFKRLQALRDSAKDIDWLSKEEGKRFGDKVFPHLLGGQSAKRSEQARAAADEYAAQVNADQKMLDDADHGIALPKDVTKAQLRARIETHSTLLGAYRDMQSWYENPLDKDKLAQARAAYTTVESRRMDIDKLEKNTGARTAQYQQDALSFRQTEAERKMALSDAEAQAQAMYAALPTNKQTPAGAAEVYQKVLDETGMKVGTESIMKGVKNPNAPQSVNKTEVHIGDKAGVKLAENAMEALKESHGNAMGANDILDGVGRIKSAIAKGNVTLGPGATIRNSISQISNLLGVQGKDQEERLVNTRETIRGLAQFAVNARKLLRGQGQVTENEQKLLIRAEAGEIDNFTLPEIKSFLSTTERLANKSLSNHQRMMDIARKKPELQGYLDFYEVKPGNQPSSPSSSKSSAQPQGGYGNRPDGTPKGAGYFGEIPSPIKPGDFSTELTIGVNLGGKETNIPLLTPNLTRSEIEMVMRGRESKEIVQKAVDHAKARMKQGKSPYAEDSDTKSLPDWKPKEFESFYSKLRKGDTYVGPDGKRRTKK